MFMYFFTDKIYRLVVFYSRFMWIALEKKRKKEILMNFCFTLKIFYWFLSGENLMAADNFLFLNKETVE